MKHVQDPQLFLTEITTHVKQVIFAAKKHKRDKREKEKGKGDPSFAFPFSTAAPPFCDSCAFLRPNPQK